MEFGGFLHQFQSTATILAFAELLATLFQPETAVKLGFMGPLIASWDSPISGGIPTPIHWGITILVDIIIGK